MDNSFHLDIISLTKSAFTGPVNSVTVPGIEGTMTILKHHIPIITPLVAGEVTIREGEKLTHMAISSGFLIVDKDKTTLMADSAEHLEELDEVKIRAAQVYAEKLLKDRQFANDREFADATAALEKSIAHLRILKKHRTRKGLPSSDSM